jgi:hypothetical protein
LKGCSLLIKHRTNQGAPPRLTPEGFRLQHPQRGRTERGRATPRNTGLRRQFQGVLRAMHQPKIEHMLTRRHCMMHHSSTDQQSMICNKGVQSSAYTTGTALQEAERIKYLYQGHAVSVQCVFGSRSFAQCSDRPTMHSMAVPLPTPHSNPINHHAQKSILFILSAVRPTTIKKCFPGEQAAVRPSCGCVRHRPCTNGLFLRC